MRTCFCAEPLFKEILNSGPDLGKNRIWIRFWKTNETSAKQKTLYIHHTKNITQRDLAVLFSFRTSCLASTSVSGGARRCQSISVPSRP